MSKSLGINQNLFSKGFLSSSKNRSPIASKQNKEEIQLIENVSVVMEANSESEDKKRS